jgi:hypothetical protein
LSYLEHELGNDSVEGGTLVAEALLAGAESTEVLCANHEEGMTVIFSKL